MEEKYKINIRCMTFNQSSYITKAMDGFTMQQTAFPFVCIVMDDASTDGEPEIIKKYLEQNFDTIDVLAVRKETDDYVLTFAQHKENRNCYFAVYYLKYNHYSIKKKKVSYFSEFAENSDYIAHCEGDDFWISPNFLQTSVSFLDKHQDYSAVFGNKLVCDEDGNIISKVRFKSDLTIHDILRGNNMGLRNLCYRKEIWKLTEQITGTRDLHVYLKCAICGKLKYFDQDFAVYRLTGKGVYTSLNQKDRVFASYSHYFELHQEIKFLYQKDYVYYQMRTLFSHIKEPELFEYSIKLIKQFHVPSKMRYVWYLLCSFSLFCSRVTRKVRKRV